MTQLPIVTLKKNEDRRIRAGHVWIYSNEIDTKLTPLKSFSPGEMVRVVTHNNAFLGNGYINPHSLISIRLFSFKPKVILNEDFFINAFIQAKQLREKLYPTPHYRLVFGESDGLPGIVIDRFDSDFVLQITTAGMELQNQNIIAALKTVFPNMNSLLFRNDSASRKYEGLSSEVVAGFGTPPKEVMLIENGFSFHAPLWEGQKTGWFYDHSLNRARLKAYVKNERVLDVFSYLGGWGIHAANYGANEVVCVDVSNIASEWIHKNAKTNHVENKVSVICDDAFDALKQLQQEKQQFSVIIVDPPAFAKKQKDLKEGLLAYQRINEAALKLLTPGGFLVSCSCSMHVSDEDFLQMLRRASLKTNSPLQIIERGHQATDHPLHIAIPETQYIKMVIARKLISD